MISETIISDLLENSTIQDLQRMDGLISWQVSIEQIDLKQIRKIMSGDDIPKAAMALVS
jgi:hypothetical protein